MDTSIKYLNRKSFSLFALLIMLSAGLTAQKAKEWEDPQVIGINKEDYHTSLLLPSAKAEASWIISLYGKWKFHWSKDPDHRPTDFYKRDYDASGWDDIVVPGNWQMQGYGLPIYSNWTYPFKNDQPRVTAEPPANYYSYENRNPVGSYVTSFDLESVIDDKQYFLHFEGVESAMYVWLNGQLVGYSENSYSPAEFDITSYVRKGDNKLAVEVYRWSDGSYIEDQDMWRLSGIFRPVELWIRPKTHICDYSITAIPSNDYSSAAIQIEASVRNCNSRAAKDLMLEIRLSGKDANAKPFLKTVSSTFPAIAPNSTSNIVLTTTIDAPALWSAEKPNLYEVELSLLHKGQKVEDLTFHTGVRNVEVRGEVLYVNGKPVKLKGVNYHEHHPRTGRYLDAETLEYDLKMMKRANINFIRTSHYPHIPLFYELCDKYGFYVMNDANNESHDFGIGNKVLGDDPQWTKAHVDRAVSMVKRDRNHPSIIIWSLGNEAAGGANAVAMREAVLSIDSTRPVFYDSDRSVSDIYDDSYLHPLRMVEVADMVKDKPFMMREYAHAMGNSLGNLDEYWELIESREDIAGAAIWQWNDHGIARKIDHSPLKYAYNSQALSTSSFDKPLSNIALGEDEYWAYGGSFGDQPNNGYTCINGLFRADRVPNPHFYQVARTYQNIEFTLVGNNKIKLRNKHFFTSLDEFDYSYEWMEGGVIINKGKASLADDILTIETTVAERKELILTIYAHIKQEQPWAEKGFVVAWEQFVVSPGEKNTLSTDAGKPSISLTGNEIRIEAAGSDYVFDAKTGALISWKSNGKEILSGALEPYFWKPANVNQLQNNYNNRLGAWRDAAKQRILKEYRTYQDEGIQSIEFKYDLPVGALYILTYSIDGTGRLKINAHYSPYKTDIPLMPKFGFRAQLSPSYDTFAWYGRGPHENYPDRKSGYMIGRYKLPIDSIMVDYAKPQDNANRCDVRSLSITGKDIPLIKIQGIDLFNFRAWTYLEEDLEKADYPFQLPDRDYINLNIDSEIHGVGGNDGWGARTMDQYTVDGNKERSFEFIIEAI